jgi:cyclophilin family peptidyl-prolyl cis-trans isomerase
MHTRERTISASAVCSLLAIALLGLAGPSGCRKAGETEALQMEKEETSAREAEKPVTPAPPAADKPIVLIETTKGTIKAELWPQKAPDTVASFLQYVDDKFYDGLIFHRVIERFMIQGGGFGTDFKKKTTRDPVKNEARADVPNERGTLAMARTAVVDSATSQFFINLVDNAFLNHRDKTPSGYGYCVFGRVTEGMDVVDAIGKVKTGPAGPFQKDAPAEPIVIKSMRRQ